ncbi:hypothetical protein FQN57_005356 [Myotisia sp. PD_48]|nr:hypothetical protein FQN57_005356 [Myotisia sp. PD_48]
MATNKYPSKTVIVPIDESFSDGDPATWPADPIYSEIDASLYLKKLAERWMIERGEYKDGAQYILNKLPEGYVYYSRVRLSQPHMRDNFLWGHPSGKYYFSPNRFWPHFQYLMNGGTVPCECEHCALGKRSKPRESGSASRPRRGNLSSGKFTELTMRNKPGPKPVGEKSGKGHVRRPKYLAVDEEGNRDVYKELVYRLKEKGVLDEPIKEPDNMDWRAEAKQLRHHLTQLEMQHSFIPRLGELVLWCTSLKGDVLFDFDTETFQMYSQQRFVGIPQWRAGVVTQVPDISPLLRDLFTETKQSSALNTSGFRIETYPDSNSTDKSLSCQYKYVPLSHTRPFNLWDIYLQGVPTTEFHSSIENALTIMSSFSMLDKYHFSGNWPNATINCHGIYLGAELLLKGDGVRLVPQDGTDNVTDVLVIENIQLCLSSCDANLSSAYLSESISPRIIGKAYTIDRYRAHSSQKLTHDEIAKSFECTGMGEYGPWYNLHAPGSTLEVSINQVIGRCFESEYMTIMFNDRSLGLDLEGVRSGRAYGRRTDHRIEPGKEWFQGDHRVETLAVETINGIEVGSCDDARDPKMWRGNLKIIDGIALPADLRDAQITKAFGRSSNKLIGSKTASSKFRNAGKMSSLVSTAIGPPLKDSLTATAKASESDEIEESDVEEVTEMKNGVVDEEDIFLQQIPALGLDEASSDQEDYAPSPPQKRRRRW